MTVAWISSEKRPDDHLLKTIFVHLCFFVFSTPKVKESESPSKRGGEPEGGGDAAALHQEGSHDPRSLKNEK